MASIQYLDRYLAGEHAQVWQELRHLTAKEFRGRYHDEAGAVAKATMKRVVRNVEIVHHRLVAMGYQFARPDRAYVKPSLETKDMLDGIERTIGPLPLSLKSFYEEVGSVDFTQSPGQLLNRKKAREGAADELGLLGHEDPLQVFPLDQMVKWAEGPHAWTQEYYFARDECEKVDCGGGGGYYALVPDEAADFQIQGMYGVDEWFVDYLRATLRGGGFRGAGEVAADGSIAKPVHPRLSLCLRLAEGLDEL